jgi:hypothetical protein
MTGHCKDCGGWLRDSDEAVRGNGGVTWRAPCANCESWQYPWTTVAADACEAFRVAHLPATTGQTTGYAADMSSLDSMALTDGTGGFGGPAEALQRSVCGLLMRQT